MPGGGYPEYRCKYFYSGECETGWVYVNGGVCARCLSLGRDLEQRKARNRFHQQPPGMPRHGRVVNMRDETLHQHLMGDGGHDDLRLNPGAGMQQMRPRTLASV